MKHGTEGMVTMSEIWKDVEGYEGLYQVSNKGNVKSFYTNRNLKPTRHNKGYLMVGLTSNHKTKTHFIHRLVAKAFLENLEQKKEVNHKDGDKTNNHIENLEWCTDVENRLHAYSMGLRTTPVFVGVNMFSLDGILVNTFQSICEASRKMHINEANIFECCIGNRKSAGGYVFKRVGEQ